jgi:hypothetical protein
LFEGHIALMLKPRLMKLHWFLSSQLGIDIQKLFRSLRGLNAFAKDWRRFKSDYHGEMTVMPCLHDRYDESGIAKGEYFWQDLSVAQWIAASLPAKHVDVGSRIDGFVAHVASFREIEVFDVRPISNHIPGVIFKQADFMQSAVAADFDASDGYCDSLSCLHALEHFGLGRYGDPIDVRGYEKGIANLAKLLQREGRLYLSTPIGRQRVEFNANWVFNPQTIIQTAHANGLLLIELHTLNTSGTGLLQVDLSEPTLTNLAEQHYNLGIFIFVKSTSAIATQAM